MAEEVTQGWEWAEAQSDMRIWLDLQQTVPMYFQFIPRPISGTFRMGGRGVDEASEPVHRVALPFDFYLGTFPVTQSQFFLSSEHVCAFSHAGLRPVESVTWHQAIEFCDWVNGEFGQNIHPYKAALPTEAQWEYACCDESNTEYHSGDGLAAIDQAGWFQGNSGRCIHRVGEKKRNSRGLYDMHGNVREWCLDDWSHDAYRNRVDGANDSVANSRPNDSDKTAKVVRGGSWAHVASQCHSRYRSMLGSQNGDSRTGLRVALIPV